MLGHDIPHMLNTCQVVTCMLVRTLLADFFQFFSTPE